MLSDEWIAEIRARAEAVPPYLGLYQDGDAITGYRLNSMGAVGLGEVPLSKPFHDLFAWAREDVLALLAERDALRARLAEVEAEKDALRQGTWVDYEEIGRLKATVASKDKQLAEAMIIVRGVADGEHSHAPEDLCGAARGPITVHGPCALVDLARSIEKKYARADASQDEHAQPRHVPGLQDQELGEEAAEQMEAILRGELGQPTRPPQDLPLGSLDMLKGHAQPSGATLTPMAGMPKPHLIDKESPCPEAISSDGDASHCWHWIGSENAPVGYICCQCQGHYATRDEHAQPSGGDGDVLIARREVFKRDNGPRSDACWEDRDSECTDITCTCPCHSPEDASKRY